MSVVQNDQLLNVLAPTDAAISCRDRSAIRVKAMDEVFRATSGIPNRVFIFDACRNNPFPNCPAASPNASRGFGYRPVTSESLPGDSVAASDRPTRGFSRDRITRSASSLISFSTDLGALALDGAPGTNSPFAAAFISELQSNKRMLIREVLDRTSKRVAKLTSFGQVPWVVTKGGEPLMCLNGENCESRSNLKAKSGLEQSRRLIEAAKNEFRKNDTVSGSLLALEAILGETENGGKTKIAEEAEKVLDAGLRSHNQLAMLDVHPHQVAFSADGKTAFVGGADSRLYGYVIDTISGRRLMGFNGHGSYSVESEDSRHQISLRPPHVNVEVLDFNAGTRRAHRLDHKASEVVLLSDKRQILSLSTDGVLKLWSLDSLALVDTIVPTEPVRHAMIDDDHRHILRYYPDGRIEIMPISTFRPSYQLKVHRFEKHGRIQYDVARDRRFRIKRQIDSRKFGSLFVRGSNVVSADIDRTGSFLVVGDVNGSITVWSMRNGRKIYSIQTESGAVELVRFIGDSRRILAHHQPPLVRSQGRGTATGSIVGATMRLWLLPEVQTARANNSQTIAMLANAKPLKGMVFITQPSGKRLLRRLKGNRKLAFLRSFPERRPNWRSVAFNPSGTRAVAVRMQDAEAWVWNTKTGQLIGRLGRHINWVRDAKFSRDGRFIATRAGNGSSAIWDAHTLRKISLIGRKTIVGGFDGVARILAFSADGSSVLTGPRETWDIRTGKRTRGGSRHVWQPVDQTMTNDGRRILQLPKETRGRYYRNQGKIVIVDVASANIVATIQAASETIVEAVFDESGRGIQSLLKSGKTVFTKVTAQKTELVELAKQKLPRCLTPKQRRQHFLSKEPPIWCVELRKWPYDSYQWREWLAAKKSGKRVALPKTD